MAHSSKNPPNIIVHHFSSKESSETSQSLLLEQGLNLVAQAAGRELWHPHSIMMSSSIDTHHTRFLYSPSPPFIAGPRSNELREWGSPANEGEIFCLKDLVEFSSTNFTPAPKRKPTVSEDCGDTHPDKKRRLDFKPLNLLIPQPHILTSPLPRATKRQVNIAPYQKSKPTMIAPYKSPLDSFNEYSRCVWVIPIRGELPWPESSSAVLLDSLKDPPPAPPSIQINELTWTTSAVTKFWEFLIGIREARNLGPLGISFHAVPSPYTEKSSRATRTITTDITDAAVGGTSVSLHSASISSVDHFKIYHDWPRSSQLRNILHAWSFESGESKIRLFVGAKLVLLDNKSRGVMIL